MTAFSQYFQNILHKSGLVNHVKDDGPLLLHGTLYFYKHIIIHHTNLVLWPFCFFKNETSFKEIEIEAPLFITKKI